MKILLDENIPHELRHFLARHDTYTVSYLGWDGTKNGALLKRAADDGFEGMLTRDTGIAHQHNLQTLPIGVVILHAQTNAMQDLLPLLPEILAALLEFPPRTIIEIGKK